MNVFRAIATTTVAAGLLLGPALTANAAPASETGSATARGTTCSISAGAPYLQAGLIKGDGRIDCTSNVYGMQLKVSLQQRVGTRWINVGVPAQGTRYGVISVWGTAYTGFSHGVFRTKSTGLVQFYGDPSWYPISKVSGPRSA